MAKDPSLRREMIATPFTEDGQPVRLELLVRTPSTPGPHPVLVLNHGSTGSGNRPALFRETCDYPNTARFFNERGWMTVFPQRRGRGRSGGLYDEGFQPDRARYACDPTIALAGLDRAMDDVDAVMQYVLSRADVQADRILIGGVSRGGVLAIACAGRWPGRFIGAINFNGGWLGRLCPSHERVNPAAFLRGAAFDKPTLWLHGSYDRYYRIAHCRANFDAFVQAGGIGRFHACKAGHGLIARPQLWHPLMNDYLAQLNPPGLPRQSPP